MSEKIALVSDFDGTISDDDFFNYITKHYFNDKALEPWREYLCGNKKHFEALSEIFAKLRVSENELKSFISTINIDRTFFELANLCNSKKIPVYICSAGSDYYIKILIGSEIEKYNINLISNKGIYSEENGLQLQANQEYYDENLGVSKAKLVSGLKQDGFYVIYCGDGIPDIGPSRIADKVFARNILYDMCKRDNIAVTKLHNFVEVKKFIEERKQ